MSNLKAELIFDQCYTLDLKGSFTYEQATEVLAQWNEIRSEISLIPKLNVCCRNISSVDSAFLAFLLEIKRFCLEHQVRVALTGLSKEKRNFFQVYGLNAVFQD